MATKIIVQPVEGPTASWKVSWKVTGSDSAAQNGHTETTFQSADVLFEKYSTPAEFFVGDESKLRLFLEHEGNQNEIQPGELGQPNALTFLLETLRTTTLDATSVKLVSPVGKGNIILSDILRQRMLDLEYIDKTATFAQPLQVYENEKWTASTDIISLFKSSLGAVRLRTTSTPTPEETLKILEGELHNRLPTPLLVPGLKRRTLAFLEGSGLLPDTGGCATQFYSAAQALGVDIIVLAVEGHWLQTRPEYAHWRKEFIPVEFGHDDGFPARIVEAVKKASVPVEAILTTFDSYHVAVAQAAVLLGLKHEPTSAYEIATDKYKISAFEGRKSFLASSAEEALDIARNNELPWPLIIKPCRGWGSELVFRVDDIQQLESYASRMNCSAAHGTEFVMEPYCDGPEVDINFVMYDGEVLFWEIGDENPKSAEIGSNSFHELDCVSPSELPQDEQTLLSESITKSLLGLGFRNGIYHCEARVDNSTTEWSVTESGSSKLVPRAVPRSKAPSSFLIECNIRPPGLNSSDIVETVWGVDYWALLIAIPLRETERVRALSQPFRQGPQYFGLMIFVSAEFDESKKGVWESGVVTEELAERRPDLAKQLSRALTYKKKGDIIPHPSTGTNTFVAYINLFSRKSRQHVLDVAAEVRKELANIIVIS